MKAFVLALLLFPFVTMAQVPDSVWVNITVIDFKSGHPIINALITVDSTFEKSVDLNGKASFLLARGYHTIEIASYLYAPRNTCIDLREDSTVNYYKMFKEDLRTNFVEGDKEGLNEKRKRRRRNK